MAWSPLQGWKAWGIWPNLDHPLSSKEAFLKAQLRSIVETRDPMLAVWHEQAERKRANREYRKQIGCGEFRTDDPVEEKNATS